MLNELIETVRIDYTCDILHQPCGSRHGKPPEGGLPCGLNNEQIHPAQVYYVGKKKQVVSCDAIAKLPYCFRDPVWLEALLEATKPSYNPVTWFQNGNVWILSVFPNGETDLWDYNDRPEDKITRISDAHAAIQKVCCDDIEEGNNPSQDVFKRVYHLIQHGEYIQSIRFGCYDIGVEPGKRPPIPVTLGQARESLDSSLVPRRVLQDD